MGTKNKYYKLNHKIRSPEVRVITDDGENLGVLKTSEAIKAAQERELDLVLITENAKPPVAKILDFNKFLYEENKKSSQSKAKSKKSKLKEFRFGPTIADDAIRIRTKRAREFIEDGNQVRITVLLRGRQRAHPELGIQKVQKFIDELSDLAKADDIKKQGNSITTILTKS